MLTSLYLAKKIQNKNSMHFTPHFAHVWLLNLKICDLFPLSFLQEEHLFMGLDLVCAVKTKNLLRLHVLTSVFIPENVFSLCAKIEEIFEIMITLIHDIVIVLVL